MAERTPKISSKMEKFKRVGYLDVPKYYGEFCFQFISLNGQGIRVIFWESARKQVAHIFIPVSAKLKRCREGRKIIPLF